MSVQGQGGSSAADAQQQGKAVVASKGPRVVEEADTLITPNDYVFVDNLRLVHPYFFDFKCFVKKRWFGKRLVDMFAEEFPLLTHEYYHRAFEAGRLRVESVSGKPLKGLPMTLESPLKDGMCVRHLVHRHEPPVLAGDVQVLQVTSEWVAVSKPACMPVHTVGQYRKNTVLGVLQAHIPDLGVLYPCYRLDKPVSGLLVLARSSEAAGRMRQTLEERTCEKVYVACVQGRFPSSAVELSHTIKGSTNHYIKIVEDSNTGEGDAGAGHGREGSAAVILVDVPLTWSAQHNHAGAVPVDGALQGVSSAGDPARPAATQFRVLSTRDDGSMSVVECRPLTGRTHQIRVHLQYMGFPIANDTQYGGTFGRPLTFRKLRQAQQEHQGGNPQLQPPQPLRPPQQQDSGPLQAKCDSQSVPQGTSSTARGGTASGGAVPLKRTRDHADVDIPDLPSTCPPPAVHQPPSHTNDDAPPILSHETKRQAMITAFTNPDIMRDSTLPVQPLQPPQQTSHAMDTTAITCVQGAQTPPPHAPSGTSPDVSVQVVSSGAAVTVDAASCGVGVEVMMNVSDKRAALLHAAVAAGLGGTLPPELHMLYHEPRYRVLPEQYEEVATWAIHITEKSHRETKKEKKRWLFVPVTSTYHTSPLCITLQEVMEITLGH